MILQTCYEGDHKTRDKIMTVILKLYSCFCHVSHVIWREMKLTVILHKNLFEIKMTSRDVTDAKWKRSSFYIAGQDKDDEDERVLWQTRMYSCTFWARPGGSCLSYISGWNASDLRRVNATRVNCTFALISHTALYSTERARADSLSLFLSQYFFPTLSLATTCVISGVCVNVLVKRARTFDNSVSAHAPPLVYKSEEYSESILCCYWLFSLPDVIILLDAFFFF